jgi:hypothetical protein
LVFVGIDWAEKHHDVCIIDEEGTILARGRVTDGVEGISKLHEMVADHVEEPEEAVVGIELDRGLLVGDLVAAGYEVVRDQSVVDGPLSRPPLDLGSEIGPR